MLLSYLLAYTKHTLVQILCKLVKTKCDLISINEMK